MKKKKLFTTRLDKKWKNVAEMLAEESRRAKVYGGKKKTIHKEL